MRRFVFFSSIQAVSSDDVSRELREAPQFPLDESNPVAPDTRYGQSKLAAEKLVLEGGYVPEAVVLRLCMVYGPGVKGNLAKMLRAVDRGRFPPLPNVPNKRSMVHVDDVVNAAILAARHPDSVGEVFIVSDGIAYSTRDIIGAMYSALDRSMPAWTIPMWMLKVVGRVGDSIGRVTGQRFAFDSDSIPKLLGSAWFSSLKLQQQLGYKAEWSLPRALPQMIAEERGPIAGESSPATPTNEARARCCYVGNRVGRFRDSDASLLRRSFVLPRPARLCIGPTGLARET